MHPQIFHNERINKRIREIKHQCWNSEEVLANSRYTQKVQYSRHSTSDDQKGSDDVQLDDFMDSTLHGFQNVEFFLKDSKVGISFLYGVHVGFSDFPHVYGGSDQYHKNHYGMNNGDT